MNYGGGWGGQKRQPKPREHHGPEHELNPRFESILKMDRNIPKNFRYPGEQPSNDTILFDGDTERKSIDIPKASMILRQAGIPVSHPHYPMIKKFNSEYQASDYYFVFASPIPWEHDENFRYIPGYTRYVIDRYGRVLNAYNKMPVTPESDTMYKLVADGPAFANAPWWAKKEMLQALAWGPLPENFIDFGGGIFSHELKFDKETGTITWVPREAVKVRNSETGQQKLYNNFPEFLVCAVEYKFGDDTQKRLAKHQRKPLEDMVSEGPWQVKSAAEADMPELPEAGGAVSESPNPTAEPTYEEPASSDEEVSFDESW
ncbi:hypothetical protein [Vibrio phage vB_VmeM-Yong XC32]|nr:hypothetical protein [Vibrio phage vB_VmeM-Yong XC31]QAX96416.1 hypothetical protein [Vibrio phage vB_VmeM-Yong XC32]QAX96733.1 hypothetical protein [Vibrio phage vB_VmeM-Yong MS31]QAX97052.1 hypothetical protein [Vibrio phage vB_VmeM-Yong MS32]